MALVIENQEHFDVVKKFAEEAGRMEELQKELDYLGNYACTEEDPDRTRCRLGYDFSPYSFYFIMDVKDNNGGYKRWFNGGLIYHGNHDRGGDGGMPTLSVNLTPQDGWRVHT